MPESRIATLTPVPLMTLDARLSCAPALRPSDRRNVLMLNGWGALASADFDVVVVAGLFAERRTVWSRVIVTAPCRARSATSDPVMSAATPLIEGCCDV